MGYKNTPGFCDRARATPIERGSAGYNAPCSQDSECASNNCYKYKNTPGFCDRARDVGGGITDDILARLGRLADALEDREGRGQLGQSMAPEMMQAWVQAAFTPRTFAANGCYTLSLSQCCKKKGGRQGDYCGQNCAPASIGNKFTSYQNGRVVTGNVCEPECWIKGTCGTAKNSPRTSFYEQRGTAELPVRRLDSACEEAGVRKAPKRLFPGEGKKCTFPTVREKLSAFFYIERLLKYNR